MAAPAVERLDHIVLTVEDIDRTCDFYTRVLGMTVESFTPTANSVKRVALHFGLNKINLHKRGSEFQPHARAPGAGTGDFCMITATPIEQAAAHIRSCGVTIEEGPVKRTGAKGPIVSIYFRDPDGNLLELSNYA
jgi:catechol 2,3-dioxygenase-like lactoylglutathione lyase family enzyme